MRQQRHYKAGAGGVPVINVNQPGGMIQIDMEEDGTIYMTQEQWDILRDISVARGFFS